MPKTSKKTIKKKEEKQFWKRYKTKTDKKRFYISILPTIREIARKSGYAIAVHGSMVRDLDLVAVPWIDKAVLPNTLVRRISNAIVGKEYWKGFNSLQMWKHKPNQRKAISILIGANVYIDLSVVPYSRHLILGGKCLNCKKEMNYWGCTKEKCNKENE